MLSHIPAYFCVFFINYCTSENMWYLSFWDCFISLNVKWFPVASILFHFVLFWGRAVLHSMYIELMSYLSSTVSFPSGSNIWAWARQKPEARNLNASILEIQPNFWKFLCAIVNIELMIYLGMKSKTHSWSLSRYQGFTFLFLFYSSLAAARSCSP